MFGEKIADDAGIVVELFDAVGPQLDAGKAEGGDVFDGLAIVASPGDGGVAVLDGRSQQRGSEC